MENSVFIRQSRLFKMNKLKKVILSKTADVSDEHIKTILQSVSLDKQYHVKATRRSKKFLNFITEENVTRYNDKLKSSCELIYGNCLPGEFKEVDGQRSSTSGWMDEHLPAAAVKTVITSTDGLQESVEHLLVIYQPASAM